MRQYIEIVKRTLDEGVRQVNRTGIDTFAIPNIDFQHDMSEGFPLLTTKKVAFKSTRVELEGFIGGITDKRWYQERGCKIWNQWANPEVVSEITRKRKFIHASVAKRYKKQVEEEQSDLGPIYGYQWRRFNQLYVSGNPICKKQPPSTHKSDQLATIVRTLSENPNDRRLVCSAWNPLQLHQMGLPSCHTEFIVTAIDGKISLHWTQRSCDLMLGVPFNIASYGLLLLLLAKDSGLEPYNLSGKLCNCHIYENQVDGAKEQISREPRVLPKVEVTQNLFDWTHEDISVQDYNPHPKIDFGAVAV